MNMDINCMCLLMNTLAYTHMHVAHRDHIHYYSWHPPCTFLASATGASALVHQIIHNGFSGLSCICRCGCSSLSLSLSLWSQSHNSPAPQGVAACQQTAWDTPSVQDTYQAILASSTDTVRAGLYICTVPCHN